MCGRATSAAVIVVGLVAATGSLLTAEWIWDAPEVIHAGTVEGRGAGAFNALAFDADGNPVVAYTDWDDEVLRVATRDGSGWNRVVVDSRNSGWGLDLAYGPRGPAISYGRTQARFAEQQADGRWTLSVIDRGGALQTALAIDPGGRPWVLFNQPPGSTKGVKASPERLVVAHRTNGRWQLEEIASAPEFFLGDIAFDINGTPWIAYGRDTDDDPTGDQLYLAYRSAGGNWHSELVVEADGQGRCSAGQSAKLVLMPSGQVAIVHNPATCSQQGTAQNSYLEVAISEAQGGPWTFETVAAECMAWSGGVGRLGSTWYVAYGLANALYLAQRADGQQTWVTTHVLTESGPVLVSTDKSGQPFTLEPEVMQLDFELTTVGTAAIAYAVSRPVLGTKGQFRGKPVGISDLKFVALQ